MLPLLLLVLHLDPPLATPNLLGRQPHLQRPSLNLRFLQALTGVNLRTGLRHPMDLLQVYMARTPLTPAYRHLPILARIFPRQIGRRLLQHLPNLHYISHNQSMPTKRLCP